MIWNPFLEDVAKVTFLSQIKPPLPYSKAGTTKSDGRNSQKYLHQTKVNLIITQTLSKFVKL